MARPSSDSDSFGMAAIVGSSDAKESDVSDVPPTRRIWGELTLIAWLASPLGTFQLDPQSLLATTTVMLASAASMKSCWTAKEKGEPGADCGRIENEEDSTGGACTVSKKASW